MIMFPMKLQNDHEELLYANRHAVTTQNHQALRAMKNTDKYSIRGKLSVLLCLCIFKALPKRLHNTAGGGGDTLQNEV